MELIWYSHALAADALGWRLDHAYFLAVPNDGSVIAAVSEVVSWLSIRWRAVAESTHQSASQPTWRP